ncbi:MAG: hypothetical protein K2F99_01365 [Muribaculaceae bacterium]|nr:hypothetical protein [Muribaculaceae bacterium]
MVKFDGIWMHPEFVAGWSKMLVDANRLKQEGRGIYSGGNTHIGSNTAAN